MRRLTTFSALGVAIVISLIVHAVILTIHFEPEIKKLVNKLPALDVVLVNAKTKKVPEKAELLAQANLDRGGNTDADRQMKTALPAPNQKTTEVKLRPSADAHSAAKAAKLKAQEAREQKRVDTLEKQAQELLTQLNATKKVESNPTQDAASADPEQGDQKAVAKSLNRADLIAASIEIDRLEAQIAKQQDEYQKRPKRRFIGARTKEASDAMYLEAWRQKVERIGNMNYPEAARNQKIYGQLRMTVSIKSDGSIEKIEIDKSSGSKVLDEAAKNIVNLAAPYAKFTEEMKRNTDILGITRTWTFTQEDELATQ
ncbi:energy transducer TonB [Methylotenera versatilis]|uniref:energy transducer TonB n=1 Tax=Methylotenera versatilis TaxID=1055487 RepID=UPI001F3DA1EF|nr:TonB family protein [Methylotenera versatilis]